MALRFGFVFPAQLPGTEEHVSALENSDEALGTRRSTSIATTDTSGIPQSDSGSTAAPPSATLLNGAVASAVHTDVAARTQGDWVDRFCCIGRDYIRAQLVILRNATVMWNTAASVFLGLVRSRIASDELPCKCVLLVVALECVVVLIWHAQIVSGIGSFLPLYLQVPRRSCMPRVSACMCA